LFYVVTFCLLFLQKYVCLFCYVNSVGRFFYYVVVYVFCSNCSIQYHTICPHIGITLKKLLFEGLHHCVVEKLDFKHFLSNYKYCERIFILLLGVLRPVFAVSLCMNYFIINCFFFVVVFTHYLASRVLCYVRNSRTKLCIWHYINWIIIFFRPLAQSRRLKTLYEHGMTAAASNQSQRC